MSLPHPELLHHDCGASAAQRWHFANDLSLMRDQLPVAAKLDAPISPKSSLRGIGKTPSIFNASREVVGFTGWTKHVASESDIERWASDPQLGICVQTRRVRAIDVDITDQALADRVLNLIEAFLVSEDYMQAPPRRCRGNSAKFLVPVVVEGELRKRAIKVSTERIELLAGGQQFVAVSTHPSGERYQWRGDALVEVDGEPLPGQGSIPVLTISQLDELWTLLEEQLGTEPAIKQHRVADSDLDADARGLDRTIALAHVSDETIKDLRSAIGALREEADDYSKWIEVGHALKSLEQGGRGGEGADLWHEFSRLSEMYDFDQAEEKWTSFDPQEITYRTVFELATARGWVNPRSALALKEGADAATRLDRTDAGNATLLADITKGDLRFVPQRRSWLLWRDNRWTVDDHGVAAQAAALQVAEHYHRQATELRRQAQSATLDDKERKRLEQAAESLEKWATHCRNKRSIDAMLALAKGDARFALGVEQLDRDPWLFGVDNGVVDLRTGQLRAAAREDYVTRRSPTAFTPAARARRWEQFIVEVTAEPDSRGGHKPRPALAAYLQRALGYAMTGSTGEHKMYMAVGDGANGKNVLLDTLQWLMGEYCVTVPPEALMAVRSDADAERPSPVAATLAGSRLAISSESRDGQRLDVALVKRHTGGGYMNARFMRENSFRFEITHKLWLMTNHRPDLDHLDDAMRGRLHLIPFDMAWNRPGHPERDPNRPDGDKALPEKLRAEAAGILAWLVAGAVAYSREGLEPPPEVVRMTRDFFADQDPLARWIETMERCEPREGTAASELLEAFRRWRDVEGETGGPDNPKSFSIALQQRHVPRLVTKGPKLYGLRLSDAEVLALTCPPPAVPS